MAASRPLLRLTDPDERAVYALVDPHERTRLRYIGQTRSIRARWESHAYGRGCNSALDVWLRELRSEGRHPEMIVLFVVSEQFVEVAEAAAVQGALADGHDLLNVLLKRRPAWLPERRKRGE